MSERRGKMRGKMEFLQSFSSGKQQIFRIHEGNSSEGFLKDKLSS